MRQLALATIAMALCVAPACGSTGATAGEQTQAAGSSGGPAGSGDASGQGGDKDLKSCGDGLCVVPETAATCPKDCPTDPTGQSGKGGKAQGGKAQGGKAQGGKAQGGKAQGGKAQGGKGQGGGTTLADCLTEKCKTEFKACNDDKECAALRLCLQGCSGDAACREACRKKSSDDVNKMQLALNKCGIGQGCIGGGKGGNQSGNQGGNQGGKGGNQGGPSGNGSSVYEFADCKTGGDCKAKCPASAIGCMCIERDGKGMKCMVACQKQDDCPKDGTVQMLCSDKKVCVTGKS